MNSVETLYLYMLHVHACTTMYNHHHAHIHVRMNALMTSQYAKLSIFPDTPLPPAMLKHCEQSVPEKSTPHLSTTDLLSHQNRKVISVLGDGNCFFRALSTIIYGPQKEHERV